MDGCAGCSHVNAPLLEYNAAMRRLLFVLRCVIVAALCLLTACASTTNTGRTDPSAPAAQPAATPVTLTLWHSWSGAELDALNSLARRYEQANPMVRIRLEMRPAAGLVREYGMNVADGSAPQLLLVRNRYIGELAAGQYIAPIDDVFEQQALDSVLPAAIDGARVEGRLYGVPLTFDTLVLFYDRRRVAAPPATVDEALALTSPLPDAPPEEQPRSLGYYLSFETALPYLAAFGGAVLNDAGQPIIATQSRDATTAWLGWLNELQKNPQAIVSPDYNAVDALVQRGQVLAVIDWAHRRSNYVQVWGDDAIGVAPLPVIAADRSPQPFLLSDVLSVNTVIAPEQRVAAEAFLRYMLEQQSQQTLLDRGQVLPVHQSVTIDPATEPYLAAAQGAQTLTSRIVAIDEPLSAMMRSVLLNTASPDEAIDAAQHSLPTPSP